MSEKTTLPAYISRNQKPGFVLCDDPSCSPTFGHPHYHEAPKQTTDPHVAMVYWHGSGVGSGGQCVAVDENGEECAAFHDHRTGKWYLCSNVVDPDLEFTPKCWTHFPHRPADWSTHYE